MTTGLILGARGCLCLSEIEYLEVLFSIEFSAIYSLGFVTPQRWGWNLSFETCNTVQ